MTYKSIEDLPLPVRSNLPTHAQEIYQAAFNQAWDEYAEPEKRYEDDGRETVAHKVAWSAVKNVYTKQDNGDWVKQ